MENMKEQRIAISEEALERVVGGTGEKYDYNTFASRIQKLSEVITTNRTRFVQVLKDADSAARSGSFETVKSKMNEVRDFFGVGSEPYKYAGWVISYLRDTGKIVYP